MLSILAAVKAVPLSATRTTIGDDGSWPAPSEWRLDPVNEVSVEWAVRLREAGQADEVVAVTIGPPAADVALRAALARGCTAAARIDAEDPDVATTAALLAATARRFDSRLVVLGYESFDGSSGVVPAAVAGALRRPLVSRARDAEVQDGALFAMRSTAAGTESAAVELPAVVSFVEGAVVPRHPRLAAMIAARSRALGMLAPDELPGTPPPVRWTSGLRRVERVPPRSRPTRVIDGERGVPELLALTSGR